MQQQPQFKAGNGHNGLEEYALLFVILQLAIKRLDLLQSVRIAAMLVAVEYRKNAVKSARLNAFVRVALLEQASGVLDDLHGIGAQLAASHGDVAYRQAQRHADFIKVERFGLAAF